MDQGELLNRAVAMGYRRDPGAIEPDEENEKVLDNADLTLKGTGTSSLSFQKTVDKKEIRAGDLLTYTFTLKNTGNKTIQDLKITDALPKVSELFGMEVNGRTVENLKDLSLLPGEVLTAKETYRMT